MARKPTTPAPAVPFDFAAAVADFKARFPAEWDALRLCPLQHGVEEIARKLKG